MSAQRPFEPPDLGALRDEAAGCTRCHLYRDATQTVFGADLAGVASLLP